MDIYSEVLSITDYIEKNIKRDLSLDDVAQQTKLSKFHLHRLFKSATGKRLMEYVRSRKLACSISELLNSDFRIIDISEEYCFKHYQCYSRAFKREYGISPEHYRKQPLALNITDKISMFDIAGSGKCLLIKPKIVIKPSFRLIGISNKVYIEDNSINNTANKIGMNFFYNHRHKIRHAADSSVYIGLTLLPDMPAPYTYYVPSLEVSDTSYIPEGMCVNVIPAQKYAVFKYIGFHSPSEISAATLGPLWYQVFRKWMPEAEFGSRIPMSFEMIDMKICTEDYCEADLHYPLYKI